jgi:hypothetical protein
MECKNQNVKIVLVKIYANMGEHDYFVKTVVIVIIVAIHGNIQEKNQHVKLVLVMPYVNMEDKN